MKKIISIILLITITFAPFGNANAIAPITDNSGYTTFSVDPGGGGGGYVPGTIFISSDFLDGKGGHAAIATSSSMVAEANMAPIYGLNKSTIYSFINRYHNIGFYVPSASYSVRNGAASLAKSLADNNYGYYALPASRQNNPYNLGVNCSGFVWYSYYHGGNLNIASDGKTVGLFTPKDLFESSSNFRTIKGSVRFH